MGHTILWPYNSNATLGEFYRNHYILHLLIEWSLFYMENLRLR